MARPNPFLCYLSFLLCFAALLSNADNKMFCIRNGGVTDGQVQKFLDFACSQLDCSAINPGGPCYEPNTFLNHGSYALDLYYRVRGDCNAEIGTLISDDPSYGNCHYP